VSKKDYVKLAEIIKRAYQSETELPTSGDLAIKRLENDLTYMLKEDNQMFNIDKWNEYIGKDALIMHG